MAMLPKSLPNVNDEFMNGNHTIKRSYQPFASIWTDMALEQSVNRDSKSKGGAIGIT